MIGRDESEGENKSELIGNISDYLRQSLFGRFSIYTVPVFLKNLNPDGLQEVLTRVTEISEEEKYRK